MSDVTDLLKEILKISQDNAHWGIIIFLLFVIFVLFKYPEKVDDWVSLISKWFSHISTHAERSTVKRGIQSKINYFSKDIEKECKTSQIPRINIEWIRGGIDRDTFFRNGEVIVRLDYHTNQDKNLMIATLCYIPHAVIPKARRFLHKKVSRSIDLTVASKFFEKEGLQVARNYFYSEVLKEEISDEKLIKFLEIMEKIDQRGLFTRLLLREFGRLGVRSYPRIMVDEIKEETREFVEFLHQLSVKDRNIDVNLHFKRDTLRISILLVARPRIIARTGVEPYIKKAKQYLKGRNVVLYIFGSGKNVDNIKLVKTYLKNNWSHSYDISSEEYETTFKDGRHAKTMCVTAIPNKIFDN